MPTVEQDRGPAIRRGKLQAPGCGLVGGFHLGDYAGERAVAQTILRYREHFGIPGPLGVEDPRRVEADLFEARRIEIEPGQRPEHRQPRRWREASGDTRREQCSRRVVGQACRRTRNLVKSATVKPATGEPVVDRIDPEGERRSTFLTRRRQFGP